MAAFEFGQRAHLGRDGYETADELRNVPDSRHETDCKKPQPPIKDECVIAFKVYDQFRLQDCLTEDEIGPARAAENGCIGDKQYCEGEVIEPPSNAASVTVEKLKVKKVIVVEKTPNSFKQGYWDVDLKFVFEYKLTFREADGCQIGSIKANSIINKKVSMFGSLDSDIVIGTDFFTHHGGETALIDAAPFILVEAKGVALSAELKYHRRRGGGHGDEHCSSPCRVDVTIGLFCIVKLFRIVDLNVQSRGFCIPPECEEPCPVNACDFFENLDFPMDIFAPPLKKEMRDGVSVNIAKSAGDKVKPCDC